MKFIICLLAMLPAIASAQNQQGMPPNMQQMDLGKLQEAVACMEGIDRSSLDGFEREGREMEAEISALCKAGKRDQAQDKAMAFAVTMMKRPEMEKMRECSQLAAGMLPKMPFEDLEEMAKDQHVCDDF